jgi:signal transduction histidine kinase
VQRVAGVTRQVLAFSDPGRTPKVLLDLRQPLGEAVDFVRRHPAFRAVTMRLELPAGPVPVVGSATTLGQLFLNLLLNAAQCQGSAGEVEVVCTLAGGCARVTVADRGPGLSHDALRHLFEPFYSTRGSTGLGLATCHGIAQDHAGSLAGRNRAAGGAEFALELPLATPLSPGGVERATATPEVDTAATRGESPIASAQVALPAAPGASR